MYSRDETTRQLTEFVASVQAGRLAPSSAARSIFRLGYKTYLSGDRCQADVAFSSAIELIEQCCEGGFYSESSLAAEQLSAAPLFPVLTRAAAAEIAFQHGRNLYSLGLFNDAKNAFRRTEELYRAIIPDGVSSRVILELADCSRWLGRACRVLEETDLANQAYVRAIELLRPLLTLLSPGTHRQECVLSLLASLLGYSKTLQPHQHTEIQRCLTEYGELLSAEFPNRARFFKQIYNVG